ncbi:MAG: TetR/AcrR family transcriptional regulator, partial [Pygmaiobacter massiliensis]
MPKELFYALPEEKRQRILDAAVQEFSCAEYHSASINQIIKTADIARGSFY